MAARGGKILISAAPRGRFIQGVISGTPKPGTCLSISSVFTMGGWHTWVPFSASSGHKRLVAVLLEDELRGGALDEARKIVGNERRRLVDQLTAHITDNTKKTAVTNSLMSKSLDDLRERVELLPPSQTNNTQNAQTGGNIPLPDFFGMVGASNGTYNKSEVENDILDIPTHDYSN